MGLNFFVSLYGNSAEPYNKAYYEAIQRLPGSLVFQKSIKAVTPTLGTDGSGPPSAKTPCFRKIINV